MTGVGFKKGDIVSNKSKTLIIRVDKIINQWSFNGTVVIISSEKYRFFYKENDIYNNLYCPYFSLHNLKTKKLEEYM